MAESSNPPADKPDSDGRVRFLRACDRCRVRKIKCSSQQPCSKCVAAKAQCSFSTQGTPLRTVLSTNRTPPPQEEHVSQEPPTKRRKSSGTRVLEHNNTAHFYTSASGHYHHAGSTSGLPLLEATRRLAKGDRSVPSPEARNEPDWSWLEGLLSDQAVPATALDTSEGVEDAEYFPGRDCRPENQLISNIWDTIPPDLMNELLRVFFIVIHPTWPILHIPTFFTNLGRWDDPSFAALVVSMCMLASRYIDDTRVLSEPGNPATAGMPYVSLFQQLLDKATSGDNVIYAIQSRLFGSMYQAVDNVPHPVAQGLVADAVARVLDGGLHRPSTLLPSPVLLEIRSRTAWAVYCWDQHIAGICGRPPLSTLFDYDVRLPEPFEADGTPGSDSAILDQDDARNITTFRYLIEASGILELTFRASVQQPEISNSPFLTNISRLLQPDLEDQEKLDQVLAVLKTWTKNVPSVISHPSPKERAAHPGSTVATEQVAAVTSIIRLMVAARKLQLETLSPTPQKACLETARATLLEEARNLTSLAVQLGASERLGQCDIMMAYRLLFTGRLLLACILSARSDDNHGQVDDATKILHATCVILRHFVRLYPVALGAAEVLDETIRVCRIPSVSAATAAGRGAQPESRYAWYRPLMHTLNKKRKVSETSNDQPPPKRHVPVDTAGQLPPNAIIDAPSVGSSSGMDPVSLFSPLDQAFVSLGNVAMPTGTPGGSAGELDISWLLPGGDAIVPYYFPNPSV